MTTYWLISHDSFTDDVSDDIDTIHLPPHHKKAAFADDVKDIENGRIYKSP